MESDNRLVFWGARKEQIELIFTLEHGLGPQRVAGWLRMALAVTVTVTTALETKTPVATNSMVQ